MRDRLLLLIFLGSSLGSLAACHEAAPPTPPLPLREIVGPSAALDTNPDPRVLEVELHAAPASLTLREGAATAGLAYNGAWPGPLLHARVGDRLIVHFTNELDEATTIHWHGLRIDSGMDGSPLTQEPIPPGGVFTYDFVLPDAGTFWYHPHLNTIEQIDRGLYGAIIVEEATAPQFTAERLFVLDDLRLDATNRIPVFQHTAAGPDVLHGREGQHLLVNGAISPSKASAPRGGIERWRLVNSAGSRVMSLELAGASARLIGTDGGLLPAPQVAGRLELAAGQRLELEVSYDGAAEQPVQLISYVLELDANDKVIERPVVIAEVAQAGSIVATPPSYPTVSLPTYAEVPVERTFALSGRTVGSEVVFTINDHAHDLPIEHYPQGKPVKFTIQNQLGMPHPFHLHGQFFQVLERDGGDVEPGLKDTVLLHGQETVTILTGMENPGRWMFHCHIPEHGENGMMAELLVDPTEGAALPTPAPHGGH